MRENVPTYNKMALLFENVELFSIIGVPSFVYPVFPLILLAISSVLQWKTMLKSVKFGSVSVRVLEGNSTETQKVQSKGPVKGVTYRGVSRVKETSALGEALRNPQHQEAVTTPSCRGKWCRWRMGAPKRGPQQEPFTSRNTAFKDSNIREKIFPPLSLPALQSPASVSH